MSGRLHAGQTYAHKGSWPAALLGILRSVSFAASVSYAYAMPLYVPKYVRPEDAVQSRAQMKRRLIWIAIAIPVVFMFLAFGYSDLAPAFLRSSIIAVDRTLGYPIIGLLSMFLG